MTSFMPGAPKTVHGPAPTTDEEIAKAITTQCEYYFSDQNLRTDDFLKEQIRSHDKKYLPIQILLRFNRIKALVPDLKIDTIAAALAQSDLLELSDDKTHVRRKPALDEKEVTLGGVTFANKDAIIATLRPLIESAKPLTDEQTAIVTDVLAHHPKAKDKTGCGIASIKVGSNPKFPATRCFVIVRTDGVEEDFSYIKCIDAIYPLQGAAGSRKRKMPARGGNEPPAKRGPAAAAAKEPEAPLFDKGTIVVAKALPEGLAIDTLKSKFGGHVRDGGPVKFVEVVEGQPLAYIRFDSAESATKALATEGSGELSILTGDDEKAYWDKILPAKRGKGGGKGRGRGRGKGRGRGRR